MVLVLASYLDKKYNKFIENTLELYELKTVILSYTVVLSPRCKTSLTPKSTQQ